MNRGVVWDKPKRDLSKVVVAVKRPKVAND